MYVCPNCFADTELKAFISSSVAIGDCSVCRTTGASIVDLQELYDFFQELLDNFSVSATGMPLRELVQSQWSFFTSHGIATTVFNEVIPYLSTPITSSDELVMYIPEISDNYNFWGTLKDDLKWKTRFVFDISRLTDLGWDGYFNTSYQLLHNDRLYRARLHQESGRPPYAINEMMAPPASKTSGGRANPSGIPYLYLSDNQETVLYEIRASYLDEISIGEFTLLPAVGSAKIVDFTEDTALFQPTKVAETIKSRLLRDIISRDLSKPMRRYDSDMEYIPTQFICEFIRIFTGASGIRFRSSLHPAGKNIVIFDQSVMSCNSVVVRNVTSIRLGSNIL